MTNREFYAAIASSENLSAELVEFAASAIKKLDAKNANKQSNASSKWAIENAPLLAKVREYLATAGTVSAATIAENCELSTPKVTALMRKMDGVTVGELKVKGRVVKTYTLAE